MFCGGLTAWAFVNSFSVDEALDNDRKDQSEDQTSNLLKDAIEGYDMSFATDIKVIYPIPKDEKTCPDGYENLFVSQWPGIAEGCV